MGFETQRAYLTDSGGSIITGLKILNIKVDRKIQVQEQPVEDGSQRQDTKVRKPITVSLSCACHSEDWDSIRGQISKTVKDSTKNTCTLCTKVETLKNMAVVDFPYDIDPENYDTLFFQFELHEIIVVGSTTKENDAIDSAMSPENNSTYQATVQAAANVNATEGSSILQNVSQTNPASDMMNSPLYAGMGSNTSAAIASVFNASTITSD